MSVLQCFHGCSQPIFVFGIYIGSITHKSFNYFNFAILSCPNYRCGSYVMSYISQALRRLRSSTFLVLGRLAIRTVVLKNSAVLLKYYPTFGVCLFDVFMEKKDTKFYSLTLKKCFKMYLFGS